MKDRYNIYYFLADDYVKFVERRDILNLLLYSYMFVRTLFRTESNHVFYYSGFLGSLGRFIGLTSLCDFETDLRAGLTDFLLGQDFVMIR